MFYQAKELGEGFPFEIQDKEGTSRITLTRKDRKERIEVDVFLPSPADSLEQNGEQEDRVEGDNRQGQASNAAANQYYIPLLVKIHKEQLHGWRSVVDLTLMNSPLRVWHLDRGISLLIHQMLKLR